MHPPKPLPDIEALRQRVKYDPDTGVILVLRPGGWREVEHNSQHKYIRVSIDGVYYYAHRLAWKMHYGTDPEIGLDHINRNRFDNRIVNLRVATAAQNNANKAATNSIGKGIRYDRKTGKYRACIGASGRRFDLGYYVTQAEALAAYRGAAVLAFGNFAQTDICGG